MASAIKWKWDYFIGELQGNYFLREMPKIDTYSRLFLYAGIFFSHLRRSFKRNFVRIATQFFLWIFGYSTLDIEFFLFFYFIFSCLLMLFIVLSLTKKNSAWFSLLRLFLTSSSSSFVVDLFGSCLVLFYFIRIQKKNNT